jgi:hypothetical protein
MHFMHVYAGPIVTLGGLAAVQGRAVLADRIVKERSKCEFIGLALYVTPVH